MRHIMTIMRIYKKSGERAERERDWEIVKWKEHNLFLPTRRILRQRKRKSRENLQYTDI